MLWLKFLKVFKLPSKCFLNNRKLSSGPIKKFYKKVTIINNVNGYEIALDGRKIKTPLNNILKVQSLSLAHMLANEWRSQEKFIKKQNMLLTQLAFTAVDNPLNLTEKQIVNQLMEWLFNDTLCFRIEESDIKNLQEKRYNPILKWLKENYNCEIPISKNILTPTIPFDTQKQIRKIFNFNQASLFSLLSIAENLKSLILTIALINRQITVPEAVSLSRLEYEYQTRIWGRIDWAHDLETNLVTAKVASGLIFFLFNCEATSQQKHN